MRAANDSSMRSPLVGWTSAGGACLPGASCHLRVGHATLPRPGAAPVGVRCQSGGVTLLAPEPAELLDRLVSGRRRGPTDDGGLLTHVARVPARPGITVPWPEWVHPELRATLAAQGIGAPWRHQVEA